MHNRLLLQAMLLVSCVTHLWAGATDSSPNTNEADGCIMTYGAGFTLKLGSDVKSVVVKPLLSWKQHWLGRCSSEDICGTSSSAWLTLTGSLQQRHKQRFICGVRPPSAQQPPRSRRWLLRQALHDYNVLVKPLLFVLPESYGHRRAKIQIKQPWSHFAGMTEGGSSLSCSTATAAQ